MSSSALVRWGGLAATVAGVLLVISAVIALGQSGEPSEIVTTGAYAFNSLLEIIAVVLPALGLVGFYARQSGAAGLLGLVGFLASARWRIFLCQGATSGDELPLQGTACQSRRGGPPLRGRALRLCVLRYASIRTLG